MEKLSLYFLLKRSMLSADRLEIGMHQLETCLFSDNAKVIGKSVRQGRFSGWFIFTTYARRTKTFYQSERGVYFSDERVELMNMLSMILDSGKRNGWKDAPTHGVLQIYSSLHELQSAMTMAGCRRIAHNSNYQNKGVVARQ